MRLRIFISYGHDEHADLARHLKQDLETRGHRVWFDESDIDRFLQGFTGRKWFFKEFQQWLNHETSGRIFFITGPPGVGKSALMSYICRQYPSVVAYHFCQHGNQDKSSALSCIQSIAYQISTQVTGYRDLLLEEDLDDLPKDAQTLFDRLLTQPLHKFSPTETPCIIVIDALDEAVNSGKNELVDVIAKEFDKTPGWLRLVITSRPDFNVLRKLSRLKPYRLKASDSHNIEDIRELLSQELALNESSAFMDDTVEILVNKSEGIFLYVTIILKEIRGKLLSLEHLEQFPQGLTSIYTFMFERYFPDIDDYKKQQRPLLELVAAGKEPLPLEMAAWALQWGDYEQDEVIEPFGSFFYEIDKTIQPFHRTLTDWLCRRKDSGVYHVSKKKGIQRLGQLCLKWDEAPEGLPRQYVFRYGIDSKSLIAALSSSPPALSEQLLQCPIYADESAQFEALAHTWNHHPQETLRDSALS